MRKAAIALTIGLVALAAMALPAAADVPPGKTLLIDHHTVGMDPALCGRAGCEFPYRITTDPFDPLCTEFAQVDFDDSAWESGGTPFGDVDNGDLTFCGGLLNTGRTVWPVWTDLLVRLEFELCAGVTGLEIHLAIDNSLRVWVNGHQVDDPDCPYAYYNGLCNWENCAYYDRTIYEVPDWMLRGGKNVIAFRAQDHGDVSVLDFDVVADISNEICENPCEFVTASVGEIWPPNHKMVPAVVWVGEGDEPVQATITSVWQDEPVKVNPGDKCPDAEISADGASVLLRAERLGPPHNPGRIYHLGYSANVGGVLCEGTVGICVPHDQGAPDNCVDAGPLFDSTTCP